MGKKFNANYNYKNTSDYDYDKANQIIDDPNDSSQFINNRDWVEGDPYGQTMPMPSMDSSPDLGQYSDMWQNPPTLSLGSDNEHAGNYTLPMPTSDSFLGKLKDSYWNLEDKINQAANSNPLGKFISRLGESGARAITGDATSNTDTGSWLGNAAADVVGTGLGFMTKLPGMNESTGSIMNKTVGQPVENTLKDFATKYGLNNKATDYAIQGLKTGTEFGAYEGLNNAVQGKDVGEGIASGMGSGLLFGVGGKAVGEAFSHFVPGLGKTKVVGQDGRNVIIKDEAGNETPMNKVIFDNTAQQIPNTEPIKPIQPFGNTLDINRPLENRMSEIPSMEELNTVLPKYNNSTYEPQNEEYWQGLYNQFKNPPKQEQIPSINTAELLTPQATPKEQLPMQERDFGNVGNRQIKSYQYLHPELKSYIQGEANVMLGELKNAQKGERYAVDANGETKPWGAQRIISDDLGYLLDTKQAKSYDAIENALNNLIKDNGAENNALSKKIELLIDDRLSNGYMHYETGIDIPKDNNYLIARNAIESLSNKEVAASNIPLLEEPFKVANSKIETPDNELEIPIPNNTIRPDFKPENAPQQQIVSSKQKNNFKDMWENFKTRVIDSNSPIKKVNNESYVKATNSKNVGGTVDYIMTKGLVNTNGNKIGDSLAKVIKDIPKKEYNDFWEYTLQKHNIARSAEEKPIYTHEDGVPFTSAESAERVKLLEQQHPEWKDKANNITKWVDDFMNEWGVNTGVVNNDLYKALRQQYPDYIPTNREFNDLEDFIPGGSGNGKGFVNQNVPLKKATGSKRNIIDPTENIMNLVNRTVRTAKYNEVGQSVLKAVEQNPAELKSLAEIIPEESIPKNKTDNIVKVLNNGEPTYMKINDKNLLGALTNINKSDIGTIESAAKKATNVFKTLITQKNPVFAIRNIARDIPTYLINTKQDNPIKAIGNLGSAFKDILANSDSYNQYKALGGGGSNFFNSEKTYKSSKELNGKSLNPLPMLGNAIEKFNNTFESAPRLAEFKNSLKKTGDVNQAMYDAADVTTNFSRGGNVTKSLDSFVPYLNAGVQGLDKLRRQFKDKPIATVLKGATSITAPTLILNHINKDNKNYKELDNRTKDNYYLFPNGDKFIKIPKSREFGVIFGSLAERTLRQIQGDPQAFKGFTNTVATNFAPSNFIENNILAPIAYNLPSNKDFANRTIVPQSMQDRSPALQYDEKTSEIAKKIGELTNLSPKQIDYVIRSYTGVIGQLALPAATKSNYTENKANNLMMPITSQFSSDPLYSNQNLQDFYDNVQKTKTNAVDKNFNEKIDSKTTTHEERLNSEFTKANKKISDLSKQASEASLKGDRDTVTQLRRKIINIASDTNKYMPLPGQDINDLPMPAGETKADISDILFKNRSKDATNIRKQAESINKSDMSVEEKDKRLNDLKSKAEKVPKYVPKSKSPIKSNSKTKNTSKKFTP